MVIIIILYPTQYFKKFTKNYPYLQAQFAIQVTQPISTHQQTMFLRLKQALPEHHVFTQMRFSTFLTAKSYTVRLKLQQKVADFVIVDQNFDVIAVIDMKDGTAKNRDQQHHEYDIVFEDVGIAMMRYSDVPTIEQIQSDVFKLKTIHL